MKTIILTILAIMFLAGPALADGETATITAQNTFTDAWNVQGRFNISISGTWVGTVTVQRSFDQGGTWHDVATYTGNTQTTGNEPSAKVVWRIGIKTGEYTSGSAVVALQR